MSYQVTLMSSFDTPHAGFPLQLVNGDQVVARAVTDATGKAAFDYTAAPGDVLRILADAGALPQGAAR